MKIYKNCEKCKYFVQHYGIHSEMHIFKISNCGHCCKFRKMKESCPEFCEETNVFENKVYKISQHYSSISNKINNLTQELHITYYNTFLNDSLTKIDYDE